MLLKDPSLRSNYSHPLLAKIESEFDDHRDQTGGDTISNKEFDDILCKYQEDVPNESQLLYDLAYESFIVRPEDSFVGKVESFEGVDSRPFPSYPEILEFLARISDEMWVAYDKEIHEHCKELASNILEKESVIKIGAEIALHQIDYNEDTSECFETIMFVLKTVVPYRDNSKFQNSVKRSELWLQEAVLM